MGTNPSGAMNQVNHLKRAAFCNWHPAFYNQ
jgi:hypothetical protein